MVKKTGKKRGSRARVKVGDEVSFMYGFRRARAEVVEDRGRVGAGGASNPENQDDHQIAGR
jgi:hypothetical protein